MEDSLGTDNAESVRVSIEQGLLKAIMVILFPRVHDSFGPHLLNWEPSPFSALILMNQTIAIVIGVMLWFDIAVIDSILHLDCL